METQSDNEPPREIPTNEEPPKEKYSYFKPSELLFVISHQTDDIPTQKEIDLLVDNQETGGLIGWSNLNKLDAKWKISRVKDRELHFPGTSQLPDPPKLDAELHEFGIKYMSPRPERRKAFSIIPVEVRFAEEYRDDKNPEGLVETDEIARLVTQFEDIRIGLQNTLNKRGDSNPAITVEAVSPNWLTSTTKTEYGGGGGPGSRPVPYTGAPATAPYMFQLPPEVEKLCQKYEERGAGVKVAILDTAPCLQQLVEAYELYHKVRPERIQKQRQERGGHPLIESLLRPGGPLHLHPASIEELFRMRALHLRDHDYRMTDHGLFIAGIIHTIAPAAELHLYEVLNSQGTGDLETIAGVLWKVADEQYRIYKETGVFQRLVVNCSLMLDIPLNGNPHSPNSAKLVESDAPRPVIGHRLTDMDPALLRYISRDSKWVERSASVFMWICDLLYFLGSRVIAAAGNDWDPADVGRPEARYPAAFGSVQGVGALKKEQPQAAIAGNQHYDVASYSDISDKPGKVGVVTLGGEAGEGKGVLGIYLGEFPEPPPEKNMSHWAWWAGTSFATPILSGVIAAVLNKPNPPPTAEGAIVALYRARAIQEAGTDYDEDLLAVTQDRIITV